MLFCVCGLYDRVMRKLETAIFLEVHSDLQTQVTAAGNQSRSGCTKGNIAELENSNIPQSAQIDLQTQVPAAGNQSRSSVLKGNIAELKWR